MVKKLDETDRRILAHLQRDCAIGVETLAEQVHLSRNACWRRVKQLEAEGVIRGRTALVDPDAVGLGLAVVVLIRTNAHNPAWLARFRDAVLALPEIQGAYRMTGDLDYMLRVRVADMKAYDAFYRKLIDHVDIADASASFVMEEIVETTALPV